MILLVLFIPSIYAYSDYLIIGGDNIGIEIKLEGLLVVDTYDIGVSNDLIKGDIITHVDNTLVSTIEEFKELLNKDKVNITYKRNNKIYTTDIKLKNEDGIYKTGLYIKDKINGVGTLTYIDPESNMFGALGHPIIEKNTMLTPNIKDGTIYESTVESINKSIIGNAGYKNASYNKDNIFGNIFENTESGIFGIYNSDNNNKLYKVSNDIKIGTAYILTELDDNIVKEYKIEIEDISYGITKNILFKVTDEELINKTGGIVQGMSGSPIIQNGNIIGAVTHVTLEDTTRGYGIFITNMLEEMEN